MMQIADIQAVAQTANPLIATLLLAVLVFREFRNSPDSGKNFLVNAAKIATLEQQVVTLQADMSSTKQTSDLLFRKIEAMGSAISDIRTNIATLVERTAHKNE